MKVSAEKGEFRSVVVTLETQEEVDILYAMLNYKPLVQAIPEIDGLWQLLKPYKSVLHNGFHETLCKKI